MEKAEEKFDRLIQNAAPGKVGAFFFSGGCHDRGRLHCNERIDEDIQLFYQALSNDGGIIGERLRALAGILRKWAIDPGVTDNCPAAARRRRQYRRPAGRHGPAGH